LNASKASYDGIVSRYLNRRFSRPIARLVAKTPVTPNQVSVVSFLIALASMGLFLGGYNLWAGLAAQFSSIVDGVDGDVARLKDMATRFGGFFDAVLDRYSDVAIIGGLTYWTVEYEVGVSLGVAVGVGLMAIVGALMVSYTRARAEASLGGAFQGVAGFLGARDARLLLVMIGALLGQGLATLLVLAVLTNATVLLRLANARSRSQEPADIKGEVQ
jgi:phosphatidylglycerophosphate synthase